MKLIINTDNLKVKIESKEDLTEMQVISAYQLATGDFKALFVEEKEEPEKDFVNLEGKKVSDGLLSHVESEFNKGSSENPLYDQIKDGVKKAMPDFGEMGQVDYICPACGYEARWNVPKRNAFVKCKECQTKIALVRAVPEDSEKETDKAGNYFIANDFFEFN